MTDNEVGMDEESSDETARPRSKTKRAPLRWWLLAVASITLGLSSGAALARANGPATVGVSSSSVLNFGGGTFSRVKDTMAPSFQLVDLRQPRRTISLEKFHGHFLIVNFWASWCPPCRKEMPALARAAHQLGDKVDFVGLDYLDERDAALAFAKNTKVRYPLAFVSAQVWASYGGYGLPTTFFVSPDGHILGRQVGGLTKARLLSLVHQVFNVAVTTKSDT